MKKQPLRVGFDLDGVILYNPARIVRPIIAGVKNIFLKKNGLKFYYPKSKLEKSIWNFLHKSSIFVAPGFEEVKKLAKEGKIEAYLVTARYSFLKDDFEKWVKKTNIKNIFKGYFYNKNDEQPHFFKEKMIKKLKLDFFVEDNWDIVKHLSLKLSDKKVFWIYNIFDKKNLHDYKFPSLKKAVERLKKHI